MHYKLQIIQTTWTENPFQIFILQLFFLVITIYVILNSLNVAFAISPTFGHREIGDQPFDIIDMKTCLEISNDTMIDRCINTQQGNQSIDILSINYFSDGKILYSTFWLVSELNMPLDYENIPSYGAFIDADSNSETGWQGIDYQIETIWNNGTWNKILYQFSTAGHTKIIQRDNQTTGDLYEIGNNFVLLNLNLSTIGSPDNFRIMFYAEDKKRDNSVWKTDFSSWIDIPGSKLTLLTTPNQIELRPDQTEVIGVQLTSEVGYMPEIYNFIIEEIPANIQIKIIRLNNNNIQNKTQPVVFEIKIPNRINPGKYNVPILSNVTQKSTIPNLPIEYTNLGYSFEKINFSITVFRSFNSAEQITNAWSLWGPIMTFIVGILTGKLGSALWEILKNYFKNKSSKYKMDNNKK